MGAPIKNGRRDMKILGIATSLRKGGNTEILVKEALSGAKIAGAKTEFVSLVGKTIKPCEGCLACTKKGKCKVDDDMQTISPKLLEADGIILGTPVYLWSLSGLAKVFIDRTFSLRHPTLRLANKIGGAIAVGSRTGLVNAISVLNLYFSNNHMISADMVTGLARDKGAIKKDLFAMKEALEMGKQMAALIRSKHRFPVEYDCGFHTYIQREYGIKSPPFE
jgi:multimeric flavodoxin WrbA